MKIDIPSLHLRQKSKIKMSFIKSEEKSGNHHSIPSTFLSKPSGTDGIQQFRKKRKQTTTYSSQEAHGIKSSSVHDFPSKQWELLQTINNENTFHNFSSYLRLDLRFVFLVSWIFSLGTSVLDVAVEACYWLSFRLRKGEKERRKNYLTSYKDVPNASQNSI